jgi:hypothetical protein
MNYSASRPPANIPTRPRSPNPLPTVRRPLRATKAFSLSIEWLEMLRLISLLLLLPCMAPSLLAQPVQYDGVRKIRLLTNRFTEGLQQVSGDYDSTAVILERMQ